MATNRADDVRVIMHGYETRRRAGATPGRLDHEVESASILRSSSSRCDEEQRPPPGPRLSTTSSASPPPSRAAPGRSLDGARTSASRWGTAVRRARTMDPLPSGNQSGRSLAVRGRSDDQERPRGGRYEIPSAHVRRSSSRAAYRDARSAAGYRSARPATGPTRSRNCSSAACGCR
jgi:hypothetical protein